MQAAQRSTLISQVTAQLRAEVSEGRWAVGMKIPPEPELAELTGTGRNTVREAVQAWCMPVCCSAIKAAAPSSSPIQS